MARIVHLSRLVAYIILSIALSQVRAGFDIGFGDDSDLTNFVTRPEIKVPIFEIRNHKPEKITPGYWFVAAYAFISQQNHASNYYQPCQSGPTIYDGEGNLVWSGACKKKNQNTCDFRAWNINGSNYLSAIYTPYAGNNDSNGHGVFMDNSYNELHEIHNPITINNFNMHELNIVDQGTRAINILFNPVKVELKDLNQPGAGWIADIGFRETDLATGNTTFEWWAAQGGGVSLAESKRPTENMNRQYPASWNWFHGNAVEKNEEGDYLLSSRYLDTIFKISGKNGTILWRLGGYNTSFDQDFEFSRQHDSRWLHSGKDKEIVSFLNNAADDQSTDYSNGMVSTTSSAMIVELDHTKSPPTARILRNILRPDGLLSRLRGNHQVQPNGNSFVCWSENAYISEHAPDGELLMEAAWRSKRFVTYRGYKFNFTAVPREAIAAKGFTYGTSAAKATTVIYVSWNGATEVVSWRFKSGHGPHGGQKAEIIGEKNKTGFETQLQVDGYHHTVFVEGLAANGSVLGTSERIHINPRLEWESVQQGILAVPPQEKNDHVFKPRFGPQKERHHFPADHFVTDVTTPETDHEAEGQAAGEATGAGAGAGGDYDTGTTPHSGHTNVKAPTVEAPIEAKVEALKSKAQEFLAHPSGNQLMMWLLGANGLLIGTILAFWRPGYRRTSSKLGRRIRRAWSPSSRSEKRVDDSD